MKAKFFNYGNYKSSNNYGVNTLCFEHNKERFYFSYETLVAFTYNGKKYVHKNDWE